jgi:hypothetical protein
MSKRFVKDYSLDGWPIADNELGTVLGTNDIVVALNSYETHYTEALAELEAAQNEIEKLKRKNLKRDEHIEILAIHFSEIKVIADGGDTSNTLTDVVGHCLGKIKAWGARWDKIERGESPRRKGNKAALEEFDKFKASIKAEGIREANDYAHKIAGDQGYFTIDGQDLLNYADKIERGESL